MNRLRSSLTHSGAGLILILILGGTMIKTCANCICAFNTRDARQKTCGKMCADVRRSATQKTNSTTSFVSTRAVTITPILPDPDTLPAAYVKRVHDLWVSLTGDAPTRIA